MSHIAKYAAKLKKVNPALMKKAMEIIAKKKGGTMGTEVREYRNAYPEKVDCSIEYPGMERGFGANFTDGGVEFVGDSYQKEKEWGKLETQVQNMYKALGTAAAARKKGYSVKIQEVGDEIKVIATQ
jgi:hypothetical protein